MSFNLGDRRVLEFCQSTFNNVDDCESDEKVFNSNFCGSNQVELSSQLLAAAKEGNNTELRKLLTLVNFSSDWLGTSPLHLAAHHGHLSTVNILLISGISIDCRTKVDKTPLHHAAESGHADIVLVLLSRGAAVDSLDMIQMTPLHWAVERGNKECVEYLLQFGSQPNQSNRFHKNSLEIANDNLRFDIYDLLLKSESIRQNHVSRSNTLTATRSIMPDGSDDFLGGDVIFANEKSPEFSSRSRLLSPKRPKITLEKPRILTANNSQAVRLLHSHGISVVPEEDKQIDLLGSGNGCGVSLTEAGKLALKFPRTNGPSFVPSSYGRPIIRKMVVKKLVPTIGLAMKSDHTISSIASKPSRDAASLYLSKSHTIKLKQISTATIVKPSYPEIKIRLETAKIQSSVPSNLSSMGMSEKKSKLQQQLAESLKSAKDFKNQLKLMDEESTAPDAI